MKKDKKSSRSIPSDLERSDKFTWKPGDLTVEKPVKKEDKKPEGEG